MILKYSLCPYETVNIGQEPGCLPIRNSAAVRIEKEQLINFLTLRKSTRVFKQQKIVPDTIQEMLNYAAYIPSDGNEYTYEFTVIQDRQSREFMTDKVLRKRIALLLEDCVLAGYQITLLTQTLGIGSCFVSLARKVFNLQKQCRESIGLTKRDQINLVIVMGYPEIHYLRSKPAWQKQVNWQ